MAISMLVLLFALHFRYDPFELWSCNYNSKQGWEVFSGDCFGSLCSWDVRGHSCCGSWTLGHEAINSIAVDPAKTLCACATDNHDIPLLDPITSKVLYSHHTTCF